MFKSHDITTGLPKHAERVIHSEKRSQGLIEILDTDPPDVAPHPLSEYGAQKSAICVCGYGFGADCTVILPRDQRKELQKFNTQFLEKAIDDQGLVNVLLMNDAKNIGAHAVLPQQAVSLHHLLVRAQSALGNAVAVMEFTWSIQADPHVKSLGGQETTPVFVQQGAVGLDAVEYLARWGPVFVLQRHYPAKIIYTEDRGLAAMPREQDYLPRARLDMLDDVAFQQLIGHAK